MCIYIHTFILESPKRNFLQTGKSENLLFKSLFSTLLPNPSSLLEMLIIQTQVAEG